MTKANVSSAFSGKVLTLLLVALAINPTQVTGEEFRLSDVFQVNLPESASTLEPAPESEAVAPAAPQQPLLRRSSTDHWRIPAQVLNPESAIDSTLTLSVEQARLREQVAAIDHRPRERDPFISLGRQVIAPPDGHVRVRIETDSKRLRAEYVFESLTSGDRLIFLHGPETLETFALPEGEWVVSLRLWHPERSQRVLELLYEPVRLHAGDAVAFRFPVNADQRVSTAQGGGRGFGGRL